MTDASATRIAAERAKKLFESLTPDNIDRLGEHYTSGAYFRDPFNEVTGLAGIARVYRHMFEQLDDVRFTILETVADDHGAMLTWNLRYRARKWRPSEERTIHGATHFKFARDGRIAYHRDYWDAAGELYAKLPLIGPVMRYLKRKLA